MKVPGRGRRAERSRHEQLAAGDAVELPTRLRRTSARGWSPWITGLLRLPAVGSHGAHATFVADIPAQASLVSGRAGRTGPLVLRGPVQLSRRRVRFKTEAFHGLDALLIVLTGDPDLKEATTATEIALPLDEVDPVIDRLIALGVSASTGP